MTMENLEPFLGAISYYENSSLNALVLLLQKEFENHIYDKEAYIGAKRLFSKICCTYKHPNSGHRIDFHNENECVLVANSLMPFLLNKYQDDYVALREYFEKGKITEKQFHYELAFSKTYARVFVNNLSDRLAPFHEFLLKYETSENDLSRGLKQLFRTLIQPKTIKQITSVSTIDICSFLPSKLIDALVYGNEMTDSLQSISAFSKEPYFPVCHENGLFRLLSAEELLDYFYKTLHRLFMKNANQAERDALMREKGINFNRMCANLFRNGFGFKNVYENMEYSGGEIDLLVVDKDCLFIIECKSRNYTDKLSGSSESYVKANQSNLEHAFEQINRFLQLLKANHHVMLKNKANNRTRVDIADFHYIIPLVINIDNMAELNADYDSRNKNCAYISYDDLSIVSNVINKRKWLLVDFLHQLISNAKADAGADDIIDMFAFYCQCKNLSLLFQDETNVVVNELGNDYFEAYFSFKTERNPIESFDSDIARFETLETESFLECITRYHEKHWATAESLLNGINN